MKAAIVLAVIFVVGCTTAPKQEEAPPPPPMVGGEPNVDYEGLKRSLGLEGPVEDLGYKEKTFNTCQVGYGYSSTHDCEKKVFAVVRYRLQCRDSVGTISTGLTASDLTAISGKTVRWTFGKKEGVDTTDGDGFGNAEGIFTVSPKRDWLRLAVGSQFLHVRAGDITRIVVPRPWCEP